MSDADVTTWPRHCSGDMYAGVPTVRSTCVSRGSAPAPRRIAMPKSSTFTRPPSMIITLAGLDVAVHDVDPVHVGEHRRDLRRDRRRPRHARRRRLVVRVVEQRLQRRAAQQLHDEPQPRGAVRRGFDPGVVDGGRAGVLELRGDPDLAQEPLAVTVQRVEDLDRLRAVRRGRDRDPAGRSTLIATRRSRRSS